MGATAVFSGAGISGDAPASLPRGFGLRDDVLRVVHTAAKQVAPSVVTDAALQTLLGSPRKLEVVLGRLWGTIGPDALQCLLALRVEVPNEAHLLSALHLARAGIHATLNFDVGIELAYDLLTGAAKLPATASPEFAELLERWKALLPSDPSPLRVVASHDEFIAWVADDSPPALLKVHGSLSRDQRHLVDVVVVDIEELGQLSSARRAAVDSLRRVDQLLITGYSGADPDVYRPLLEAAEHSQAATWSCYSLDDASPVQHDAPARGIVLRLGAPAGLAVTALRELLGLSDSPRWPEIVLSGRHYRDRFDHWTTWLLNRHRPHSLTQAWAWLVADLGDLDTAEAILAQLTRDDPNPGSLLRLAEVLYTRARGEDRRHAAELYGRVATRPDAGLAERNQCRLRASDIARGHTVRGPGWLSALPQLLRAIAGPIQVLITTGGGRRDPESAADAHRALQQTGLRVVERLAGSVPTWSWPLLAAWCRALTSFGHHGEALATNGNRRALIRHHRAHLTALAAFLADRCPPPDLDQEVTALHDTYATADDLPGAGNCSVTLAVIAAARHDLPKVQARLATAYEEYSVGRPGGIPIASGRALLSVTHQIFDRRLVKDELEWKGNSLKNAEIE